MDLKPLYLADLLALSISVIAGSSGNYLMAIPASSAGLGISSYLIAKVPKKEDSEKLYQSRILELESEIAKLSESSQWHQKLIESTEAKKSEELAALKAVYELRLIDTQNALQSLSESKDKELVNVRELEAMKLAELTQQYESEKAELELAFNTKISELENGLKDTYQWRDDTLKLEQELKALEAELKLKQKTLSLEEKRIKLDIRDERGATKKMLDDALNEVQTVTLINEKLKHQIVELKTQNEQLYNDLYAPKSDNPDDEILTTIQATLGQNGVQTEFISRSNSGSVEIIKLKPTTYFEPTKLKTTEEILPGLIDIPQPKIEAKKGMIQVKIDRRDELDRIVDMPENWLEKLYQDAAKDGKNLAILGARGKGKTELAKNYCGLVISNESDSEIIYIQPKVDDYATFKIGSKIFEPDYIGFEPITNNSGLVIPSAYDGILYLKKLYDERNKANQEAFVNGEPSPKFNRVFFLIDELQLLVSREREFVDADIIKAEKLRLNQTFCGKIVRDAVSVGRSLGITALALGQLPNVSVYGWNKNDLYQYITIFMSANISESANSYAPTKEEKNRILGDLELWRKRASIDTSKDYYCYVRPMDKSGYLALLPTLGKYLD